MALSDQVARLEERARSFETEQGKHKRRLDFLSTSHRDLERVVNAMAKKDEIAEAVAMRIGQRDGHRLTVAQKILGGSVALATLTGIWLEIAIQLSNKHG